MPDLPIARPLTRAQFEGALIDLVANGLTSRRKRPDDLLVNAQTPLFESGLVDSLAILELIGFVERVTGRRIPARQVHMKHFGTIDRICAAFWHDQDEARHDSREQMVS
jgi:acyl carrier protein